MIKKIRIMLFSSVSKAPKVIKEQKIKIHSVKVKKSFLSKLKDMITGLKTKLLHGRMIVHGNSNLGSQSSRVNHPASRAHDSQFNSEDLPLGEMVNIKHNPSKKLESYQGSEVEFSQSVQNITSKNELTQTRLSNIAQHWMSPADHRFWEQQETKKEKLDYMSCVKQESHEFIMLKKQNLFHIEAEKKKMLQMQLDPDVSEEILDTCDKLYTAEKNKQYDVFFPIAYLSSTQIVRQNLAKKFLRGQISETEFNQRMDITENTELNIKYLIGKNSGKPISDSQKIMILQYAHQHPLLKNNHHIQDVLGLLQDKIPHIESMVQSTIEFIGDILNPNLKMTKKTTIQYNKKMTKLKQNMIKKYKQSINILAHEMLSRNKKNKENTRKIKNKLQVALKSKDCISISVYHKQLISLNNDMLQIADSSTPAPTSTPTT